MGSGLDMSVKCPICGKLLVEITPSHVKTHGLTRPEFILMYPDCNLGSLRYGRVYDENHKYIKSIVGRSAKRFKNNINGGSNNDNF